jgi:hypothetical protein
MMISRYVYIKIAAGQNPHTPLVGGATERRQVVSVSGARRKHVGSDVLSATRLRNGRMCARMLPGRRGMRRNTASWNSNVVRALANQLIPASTWQGKRRGMRAHAPAGFMDTVVRKI